MSTASIKYLNAIHGSYKISISKAFADVPSDHPYAAFVGLPDVKISRQDTDVTLLHSKALLTVNGIILPTATDGDNLWILNGAKTMVQSASNHVGILSFMGYRDNLTKYQITEAMITADPNYTLYDKLFITAPAPVSTIALVLGGYLQLEQPDVLYRVSDTTFVLCLSKLDYIGRLYELYNYTDIFSQLGLTLQPGTRPLIDEALAISDLYIKRFMTLVNSMMVSIPTNNLTQNKLYLSQNTTPGKFVSLAEPVDPMFSNSGKLIEYFKCRTSTAWNSEVMDWVYETHLLSSMSQTKINVLNMHRDAVDTIRIAGVYLLNMSSTL